MGSNIVDRQGRYVTVVLVTVTLVDVRAGGQSVACIASDARALERPNDVGAVPEGVLHTTRTSGTSVGKCCKHRNPDVSTFLMRVPGNAFEWYF